VRPACLLRARRNLEDNALSGSVPSSISSLTAIAKLCAQTPNPLPCCVTIAFIFWMHWPRLCTQFIARNIACVCAVHEERIGAVCARLMTTCLRCPCPCARSMAAGRPHARARAYANPRMATLVPGERLCFIVACTLGAAALAARLTFDTYSGCV
jgi:hypothetical protein